MNFSRSDTESVKALRENAKRNPDLPMEKVCVLRDYDDDPTVLIMMRLLACQVLIGERTVDWCRDLMAGLTADLPEGLKDICVETLRVALEFMEAEAAGVITVD
jgi:DNA-binding NarL/FixJ family response regulator